MCKSGNFATGMAVVESLKACHNLGALNDSNMYCICQSAISHSPLGVALLSCPCPLESSVLTESEVTRQRRFATFASVATLFDQCDRVP